MYLMTEAPIYFVLAADAGAATKPHLPSICYRPRDLFYSSPSSESLFHMLLKSMGALVWSRKYLTNLEADGFHTKAHAQQIHRLTWYPLIIGLICFNIGVLTVDEYYSSHDSVLMEATVTQTAMEAVGPGSDMSTITNKSILNPHLLWSLGGLDQDSGINRLQLFFLCVSILIFRQIDKLKLWGIGICLTNVCNWPS